MYELLLACLFTSLASVELASVELASVESEVLPINTSTEQLAGNILHF